MKRYETKSLIAISALLTDKFGYKKDKENTDSTKNYTRIMYSMLFNNGEGLDFNEKHIYKTNLEPLIVESTKYSDKATTILSWIRNLELTSFSTPSDVFLAKMKRVASKDFIYDNEIGYIVCLPQSYNRNNKTGSQSEQPVVQSEPKPETIDRPIESVQAETLNHEEPKFEDELFHIDGMSFGKKAGFKPTVAWVRKYFNKFNELYWNGELMVPDKLGLSTSKTFGGVVKTRFTGNKRTRQIKSIMHMELLISTSILYPEKHVAEVLLHEMIHVYQNGTLKITGDHDKTFLPEKKRLDNLGWEIPIVETAKLQATAAVNMDLANKFARNNYYVKVVDDRDHVRFCFIPKSRVSKFNDVKKFFIERGAYKSVDYYNILDGSHFYDKYQTNRSDFRGYSTSEEGVKKLEDENKIKIVTDKKVLNESEVKDIMETTHSKPIAKIGDAYVVDKDVDGENVMFTTVIY